MPAPVKPSIFAEDLDKVDIRVGTIVQFGTSPARTAR